MKRRLLQHKFFNKLNFVNAQIKPLLKLGRSLEPLEKEIAPLNFWKVESTGLGSRKFNVFWLRNHVIRRKMLASCLSDGSNHKTRNLGNLYECSREVILSALLYRRHRKHHIRQRKCHYLSAHTVMSVHPWRNLFCNQAGRYC